MWISNYWYERLPALYFAAAGLTLVFLGDRKPALLSALLLLTSALLVRHWRRSHRVLRGGV